MIRKDPLFWVVVSVAVLSVIALIVIIAVFVRKPNEVSGSDNSSQIDQLPTNNIQTLPETTTIIEETTNIEDILGLENGDSNSNDLTDLTAEDFSIDIYAANDTSSDYLSKFTELGDYYEQFKPYIRYNESGNPVAGIETYSLSTRNGVRLEPMESEESTETNESVGSIQWGLTIEETDDPASEYTVLSISRKNSTDYKPALRDNCQFTYTSEHLKKKISPVTRNDTIIESEADMAIRPDLKCFMRK